MKKILMLPLDERPCNYGFPQIMPKAGFEILMPPIELMGLKKRPADTDKIADWLMENAKDCDLLILSMDTLIYGGLIPSRLHHDSVEFLNQRGNLVYKLKKTYPNLRIFAFQTIMRCPFYSLSDEEPDYYATYGAQIHKYGRYTHKNRLGILTQEELTEFEQIKGIIPKDVLNDFESRRNTNLKVLFNTLKMVKDKTIEACVIPQDDSAPYGYTSMDQEVVREFLRENNLILQVPVYPAADDTGFTMLNRAVNDYYGYKPKVFVYYASTKGATVIPSFEDRIIDATIKNQIYAAGMLRVYSLVEADILLAVNIGGEMLYLPKKEQMVVPYDIERNFAEYIEQIKYALSLGKVVGVGDVAHPTGADLELMSILKSEDLLLKIHGYASWNTSSNTLGTVLCQCGLYFHGKDEKGNKQFLIHRYYDDVGYCTHTRTFIDETAVPQNGCTVFKLDGVNGKCVAAARTELIRYMNENYPQISKYVKDVKVSSPWNRTFEMEFILETQDL